MTMHGEAGRGRRPSQVSSSESRGPVKTAAATPKPAKRIKSREACLEDFGTDYPTPPPEANGEDF